MRAPERFLIIRLSSLGDILHALPAFGSLRAAFPAAEIDWLVENKNSYLLSAIPSLNRIITIDTGALRRNPGKLSSWLPLREAVRTIRARHYDFCIDFQGLLKTALISILSGAGTRVGFPRALVREWPAHWFYQRCPVPPEAPTHIVALNQLLASSVGAPPSPPKIQFTLDPADLNGIQSLLEAEKLTDFILINPGGGWQTKNWHPHRYGKLAERIQNELGLPVVVTTGPGEENLFDAMVTQCDKARLRHFKVSFLQLIPLLRRARLLVGGDTGPFHLACALGTPVVGIFGPTAPVRNGPWTDREESVYRLLPCSFCNGRTCPTQNECMDIPVEEVFEAVVTRLARCS